MAEGNRLRNAGTPGIRVRAAQFTFTNPYPWMSDAEAMVHLELERRSIPFSWRYFDAPASEAPTYYAMMTGNYYPEFTLREYRIVIVVIGNFFGTLPGIIDKVALAQVLLEADGWKFISLYEQDIKSDVAGAINRAAPELAHPTITGPPKANPFGVPDFMARRRHTLHDRRSGHFSTSSPKGGTRTDEQRRGTRNHRRFGELGRKRRGLRG